MNDFVVFPAIDLRHGRVVRLAQGDPQRQTVYGDDPRAMAAHWQAQGAAWLHVVNLDGALGEAGGPNEQALQAILALGLPVQFGGGLRDEAGLRRVLEAGVARAVIGTAAVERPELVGWALGTYGPERIAVGIDARDGWVRIKGWAEAAAVRPLDLGRHLCRLGLEWCIFTDIARDGLGVGLNVDACLDLARETGLRVIASGGVAGLADIRRVRAAGLAGVIIGRALYDGTVTLAEALC
jgi:phosphoribosylformimino-5-aminoimidazole carboxamide ribotide isomerase